MIATTTMTAPALPITQPEPEMSTISKIGRERIARRAYRISLSRNGEFGNPTLDWLQAELELQAERRSRG